MNYYERHLGDYARDTGHLSALEHGMYCLLLDRYYATEQPIPADQVHRLARARSRKEKAAVDVVLNEFFWLQEDGWHNKRCDEEIARYREGDAGREQKEANEKERTRRHREERSRMFTALREHGITPAWNIPMPKLRQMFNDTCNAPATATEQEPDDTCNAPATHLQRLTRHQTPISLPHCVRKRVWFAHPTPRLETTRENPSVRRTAHACRKTGHPRRLMCCTPSNRAWTDAMKPRNSATTGTAWLVARGASRTGARHGVTGFDALPNTPLNPSRADIASMEKIEQALSSNVSTLTRCTTNANACNTSAAAGSSPTEGTTISLHWLRRLWERMTALYGHTWVSVHSMSPQRQDGTLSVDGETWQQTLTGLDAHQFAQGLQACIAEGGEFPPSAPRFRAMCLDIPTLAQVRRDFTARNTPFAVKCGEFIDRWDYRPADGPAAERMLRDAYAQARDFVMRGGVLPEVPVALIEAEAPQAPKPASPETARAAFEKIDEMFSNADLIAREEKIMAEFHISRNQAHEMIESGVV